ncbi:MAG: hypothetical protein NUW01_08925, partial [Gemmatimonadaceae bacterium]|nr:hypothetical protein [Gemmatimonadaceae bacterium]
MVTEVSQASDAPVQAAQRQSDTQRRESAVSAARDTLAQTDATPQAPADGGTEAPPNTESPPPVEGGAPGPASPAGEPAPAAAEIDWSNEEQRASELTRLRAESDTDWKQRFDNQRRSLTGEIQAERARMQQAGLLAELDSLKNEDPDAYTTRLESDPNAARAIAMRNSMVSPEIVGQVRVTLATEQAQML